jgi:hypothetical protein
LLFIKPIPFTAQVMNTESTESRNARGASIGRWQRSRRRVSRDRNQRRHCRDHARRRQDQSLHSFGRNDSPTLQRRRVVTKGPAAIDSDRIPSARHALVVGEIAPTAAVRAHPRVLQPPGSARGVNARVPEGHAGQLFRAADVHDDRDIRLPVSQEVDLVWADARAVAASQQGDRGRLAGAQAVIVYSSLDRAVAHGDCCGMQCAVEPFEKGPFDGCVLIVVVLIEICLLSAPVSGV